VNSRRFTAPVPPVLQNERNSTQGTAALRDFDQAYDRSGSKAALQPCRLQCPVCPKADTTGLFMSTRPSDVHEKIIPSRHRCAVPGNRNGARLRRLRERRDRQIRLGMCRTLPASRAARRVSPPPHRPRVSRRHSSVRPDTDLLKISRVLINRGALMSAMPLIAARKRTFPNRRFVPLANIGAIRSRYTRQDQAQPSNR